MKQFVIDTFTNRLFGGNPAAVCILDHWPDEKLLRSIAQENNLSETAFAVKEGDGYKLRFLTLEGEMDLCGHATLAAAYVLMNDVDPTLQTVRFYTRSGALVVQRKGELFEIDFPCYHLAPVEVTEDIVAALGGARPTEVWRDRDLVCVFDNEQAVLDVRPDIEKILALDATLVHITAPGTQYDCVSRSFGPKIGVDEDPVCGSGHCHIVPLWAQRMNKTDLVAQQASARGGVLYCHVNGDRVQLAGKAVVYATSELNITL